MLLTTRAVSMGHLASRMEVETLDQETGALFLLRRAGLLAADASLDQATYRDLALARELVGKMGGLPLALDQAGAYVEEMQCSLADYLHLYSKHWTALLNERGGLVPDHPEPVATTWSLSFRAIEQTRPAAADLLRVCAFLQPDAIPEEIILEGAQFLGPQIQSLATDPLAFNRAINALLSYSLIRRNPIEHLFSVHRLVQTVLCDAMGEQDRQQWTASVVQALNAAFPETKESVTHEVWRQCERLTPHALTCARCAVSQEKDNVALAALLTKTADYLRERAQCEEAEPLYQQALSICEYKLGPEHLQMAFPLNGLANIYREQGKYERAEPLYQRALHIWKHALGSDHPRVAYALNNLAELYRKQGKYEQVEPLHQQALHIWKHALGPEHPLVAHSLNNLANIYRDQGKYEQAELFYQQALSIREQTQGLEHPEVTYPLISLAELYRKQGKYEQAELLCQRALGIRERTLGPEHPLVAHSLNRLANIYKDQGKYEQAELLYQRALTLRQRHRGPQHPETAESLHDFATFQHMHGRRAEALSLYQQALAIREQQLGPQHPDTVLTQTSYTQVLREADRPDEAAALKMHVSELTDTGAMKNEAEQVNQKSTQ